MKTILAILLKLSDIVQILKAHQKATAELGQHFTLPNKWEMEILFLFVSRRREIDCLLLSVFWWEVRSGDSWKEFMRATEENLIVSIFPSVEPQKLSQNGYESQYLIKWLITGTLTFDQTANKLKYPSYLLLTIRYVFFHNINSPRTDFSDSSTSTMSA